MTAIPQRRQQKTTKAYEEVEYVDNRGRVIETERVPVVNTYRAGHSAGLHPEDQPYTTVPQEYDDPPRQRSSAIRYTTTRGQQVIQRGNQRLVIHEEEPPPAKRRIHWLVILGLGMLVMFLLFLGISMVSTWWTNRALDSTYGFPRTWQTDAVVFPGDTATHP